MTEESHRTSTNASWKDIAQFMQSSLPFRKKIENFPLLEGEQWESWAEATLLQSKQNCHRIKKYSLYIQLLRNQWTAQDNLLQKLSMISIPSLLLNEWRQLGDCLDDASYVLKNCQRKLERGCPVSLDLLQELPLKQDIDSYRFSLSHLSKKLIAHMI